MKKEIMNTVANMKVSEMRKVAGQYGIKNASKYKRADLEPMLVEAMYEAAKAKAKAEKANNKKAGKGKAAKVSNGQVEAMADAIIGNGMCAEELMLQNRKVLIVMKKLHCNRWYRTYDKPTMVALISDKMAA